MTSDSGNKFSGVVEMDGVYVGNYIKPANNINDRIDRRKAFKPILYRFEKEICLEAEPVKLRLLY